jgi:hypothetical protein
MQSNFLLLSVVDVIIELRVEYNILQNSLQKLINFGGTLLLCIFLQLFGTIFCLLFLLIAAHLLKQHLSQIILLLFRFEGNAMFVEEYVMLQPFCVLLACAIDVNADLNFAVAAFHFCKLHETKGLLHFCVKTKPINAKRMIDLTLLL